MPDTFPDEARIIGELLDSGFDRVHIRKPGWEDRRVRELLERIEKRHHPRISLHQNPELVGEGPGRFNVGFHINSRYPSAPEGAVCVSKTCHSIAEARTASEDPKIEYQTLSPVFDSISKAGYAGVFGDVQRTDIPAGTIGLGGVTPERCRWLLKKGFGGAAMLGYIWQHENVGEEAQTILKTLN